jgi:hypothetical protein
MGRVVGHLLLLRSWGSLDLLDVGRLMGLRLGIRGMRRRIMRLGRGLGRRRLVRRVGVVLLLVLLVVVLRVLGMLRVLRVLRVVLVLVLLLDSAGPRMVLRVMGRRWQALGRVGVMLVGRTQVSNEQRAAAAAAAICKKKKNGSESGRRKKKG